jgi:hypothetical protein
MAAGFMAGKAMTRHGALRAARRHPLARLSAVLALFCYALVGLSPLWVPAAERGGIEVCTGDGIRIIAEALPFSDAPDGKQQQKSGCPLCALQAAFLLPPAAGALEPFERRTSTFAPPVAAGDRAGLFAGFDHLSRAPPVLS